MLKESSPKLFEYYQVLKDSFICPDYFTDFYPVLQKAYYPNYLFIFVSTINYIY